MRITNIVAQAMCSNMLKLRFRSTAAISHCRKVADIALGLNNRAKRGFRKNSAADGPPASIPVATCTWRNRRRWILEQFAHEKTIERGFRRSIDSPSPKKRNIHGKNMIGIILQIGNHVHYNLRRILSKMALFSYDG